MRRTPKALAAAVAGAVVLAACGGGSTDTGSAAAPPPSATPTGADVKTGPGITADTITLGVLTDLSGPFKELSTAMQAGHKIWMDEINAKGGVCGRKIAIQTMDHGYKADQAKIEFPDIEPKVAGFLELLGSPVIAALKADINDKQVTTMAYSWSSQLLDQPYVTIVGTTYDLEMIDGLDYLLDNGKLKKGDKIGHIYVDGEYGGNGLLGSKYFAAQHGMTVVEGKVTATDTDLRSIVTNFKGEGIKALALTTTPTQAASAASNNAALGLNVPMIGNNPVFATALLDGPAAAALDGKLTVAQSAVPFSSTIPKAQELAATYAKQYPDGKPNYTVGFGYALGEIWAQVLEKACAAKDLTRAGLHAALTGLTKVNTDNLVADLDFSKPGRPASRQVYIAVVDKTTPGGLKQLQDLKEYSDAVTYKAPYQS
ncbi:MAG TPA: ABC transporter substrate-binding protein [Sporichthyaceae bacterium]|jgi:ABC-type branched-subunit amino acid transport system substrate-binding protein|nr:ABC transporter substrate-binding protein [Sporichthyaceae bacterium]